MSFQLPYDLGRYVIERRHAAGGMATVFEGWQKPPMKRPVAVKIMHPHIAERPEAVERFEREAANCARVQHENTVLVYDYGVLEPGDGLRLPYIVMEWIDGFDLKNWLQKKHSRLPLEVALFVIREVAVALKHAHGCQVIHRDLKPSNVMLTADSRVKLMDFGLARAHDDKQITDAGAQLGTAPYMSPEQTRGRELTGEDGERSDVFSMGSLCYELLAGDPPFQGKGLADILVAVANHDPPPIAKRNPLVPTRLAETIERAMRKLPVERCPNMSEFLAAAEAAAKEAGLDGGRQILARYLEQPAQTAKELERDRRTRHDSRRGQTALPAPAPVRETHRAPRPEPGSGRARERADEAPHNESADVERLQRTIRRTLIALAAVILLTTIVVAWRISHPPEPDSNGGPPAHAESAPVPAQLAIESIPPGASARVNGKASGTTPLMVGGRTGDSMSIELAKIGFEPFATSLILTARMPPLRVPLVSIASRTYSISTSPGNAEVYVDGASVSLPWPMSAQLGPGVHRFLVRHGAGEREFTYEVRAGDTARTLVLHYDSGQLEPR